MTSGASGAAGAPRTGSSGPDLGPPRRVRPGEPGWPTSADWDRLSAQVGSRLVKVESPLRRCGEAASGPACAEVLRELRNPYDIGDQVGLKERGHSDQGTSCAPDSLLIWTHAIDGLELHDGFFGHGCEGQANPQPAVTVGAGALWRAAYEAVTTRGGRYVQGGGCATVGVAGLVQSGGFGSFSKYYGLAAAGLLEAEVVTAAGAVRIANACTNSDLFWGLKGGGGEAWGSSPDSRCARGNYRRNSARSSEGSPQRTMTRFAT
jgi:hypothetical protein